MWKSGFTTYSSNWKLSSNGKSQLVTTMNPSNEPILKWFLHFFIKSIQIQFHSYFKLFVIIFNFHTLVSSNDLSNCSTFESCSSKVFVKTIFSITSLSILSSTRIDFDQFSSSSPPMRLRLYWISHHFPDWIGVWVKLKLLLLYFLSVAIIFCKRSETNLTFLN